MKRTFFSYSFGCRVNEAEKEEIDRKMLEAGYRYSASNPAIYIINTCSVTAKAEREARQHIYQTRRRFPSSRIVVTGCSATYWKKNALYEDLPADEIYDNMEKEYLVKLLLKQRGNIHPQPSKPVSKFLDSGRLLMKIQDGCQRFCTFCIVPYLRGKPKSERIQDLILRMRNYDNHIKEVILTAINTESFGYDTGEKFIDLVQSIIDETSVPRISFGSIHPWSIDTEFLSFYKKAIPSKRLVDFFHIPLQSGSNRMLSLMKRGYTKEDMLEKIREIKKVSEFAFIGTDIITGFLDETDKDFQDTLEFLESAPIDRFHIFRFSKRRNTAAYYLSKRLHETPNHIKRLRAGKLAALGKKKYELFLQKHIGHTFTGLFLRERPNGFQKALLSNQIPVYVPSNINLSTEIRQIRITEYKKGALFGKII